MVLNPGSKTILIVQSLPAGVENSVLHVQVFRSQEGR
jgi:hypothetical protein